MFDEFTKSFGNVDEVILTDIFSSQREMPDLTVSSKHLAEAMAKIHKRVMLDSTLEDVVKYVNQKRFGSDTVLVTMGAGDVYKIHSKLEFV